MNFNPEQEIKPKNETEIDSEIFEDSKLLREQEFNNNIPSAEQDLINKNTIVINSINRMDISTILYYDIIQKYQYKFYNTQKGIYLYSFALNPLDLQPSGSINFSKIDDAYINLTMNPIVNYQNPVLIQAYGIQYNILKISNGIGGLIYVL